MFRNLSKDNILDTLGYYLIVGILVTLALSAFNLNSYCVVLLFLCTLLKGDSKGAIRTAWQVPFFRACTVLFIVYAMGVLYSSDWKEGLKDLEKRLGLFVIPYI